MLFAQGQRDFGKNHAAALRMGQTRRDAEAWLWDKKSPTVQERERGKRGTKRAC